MTGLFADRSKFSKLNTDSTLTQLMSLQNYLWTIHNRGEISDDEYANFRQQSTKPARTHGLPKIHKPFDNLPTFRPIIDTTGTAYQPVVKYLFRLLNPLAHNDFSLQDSFDAVTLVRSIPQNLFSEGYRFVSFDVKSLFTNIPLKKTVHIILHRIYNEKQLDTSLKKLTLKKLLLDSCTNTPFLTNGNPYKQIDGVAMGSPLGSTLANITTTALEEDIVKRLIDSKIIKFYVRFVDDTLVLAKPSDIPAILEQLNSYHSQIQFTHEEFVDKNDAHFLDIKITPSRTTIFRKSTLIDQYIHLSSFRPWSRKTTWIRSLIDRAYKICSCKSLLSDELNNILKLTSWNGFPKRIRTAGQKLHLHRLDLNKSNRP